jgi:hypothetical protein
MLKQPVNFKTVYLNLNYTYFNISSKVLLYNTEFKLSVIYFILRFVLCYVKININFILDNTSNSISQQHQYLTNTDFLTEVFVPSGCSM